MTDREAPVRMGKAARNETRKAVATTANALSIAMLITAAIQPMTSGRPLGFGAFVAAAAFIVLQGLAHYVLRKVED
ncbi:hypothetical protein DMC25_21650 [Caulobacter sp. D4A]|nr:hypothetical protein DMC25_21650 [Caulobacter sp. D4A]PXA84421.1 hypothetical protein DMC18_23840 [Caulobacter sp. D5]